MGDMTLATEMLIAGMMLANEALIALTIILYMRGQPPITPEPDPDQLTKVKPATDQQSSNIEMQPASLPVLVPG